MKIFSSFNPSSERARPEAFFNIILGENNCSDLQLKNLS